MKFGKRLKDDLCEVGWEEHYVRYRLLKKVIKVLALVNAGSESAMLSDVLSIFPRKKKMLRNLSVSMSVECTLCKRWKVFSCVVDDDVQHVRSFLEATTAALCESYYSKVAPNVEALLAKTKQEAVMHSTEPNLYPGSQVLETLAKFAMFVDTLEALRRFVVVNDQALEKITKKFKKRVLGSVDIGAASCGADCARHLFVGLEDSGESDLDSLYGDAEAAARSSDVDDEEEDPAAARAGSLSEVKMDNPQQTNSVERATVGSRFGHTWLRRLEKSCPQQWATLRELEAASALLESKIMIECSTFHDFVLDHKTQLAGQRHQDKLARVEAREMMLTRLTQHIDLENQARPAAFLVAGVVLPLLTLAVTYYISASIYVEEGVTIFDEKGYFISASIDRAPASNIGTLGLTTTLSLLSVIIFVKHKIVKKQLRGRSWMRTHRIATAFGLISCFCGNGVAAFQHQFHATAHNSFAATFFLFGMIHVVLETVIDVYHALSMPFTRKVRLAVALVLVFCVLGFLVPMAYVLVHPEFPLPRLVFWKKVAASFEVAAFACFVIWFASYYSILKASQFKLHVQYRVRLDSSEELTALRFSRHHHRSRSNDSLEDVEWRDYENEALLGLEPSTPDLDLDGPGLDIDQVEFQPSSGTTSKSLIMASTNGLRARSARNRDQ